jgi:arylsulfatase A-like enzyme
MILAAVLSSCSSVHPTVFGEGASPTPPPATAGANLHSGLGGTGPARPNIVFILTDDLSWDLVRYMPHVLALQRAGMTFTNYTVSDSLCCPSRSTIFTGKYPHDTGVFTNISPDGGFAAFHRLHDESATFATALHAAGYRTAMMGKYLNGYEPYFAYQPNGLPAPISPFAPTANYVPPGWSTWAGIGGGYREYDFDVNQDHVIHHYGYAPQDFGVDVLSRLGQQFMTASTQAHQPFLLEIAPFAPHFPYAAAYRDRQSFPGLTAPRGPAFNRIPRHAPRWLAHHPHLSPSNIANIDKAFRMRVQAVQSVDRMIGDLRTQLRDSGQLANTVFMFSSDNGLHLGQYTLNPGKLTAFDTDIRVPLVVTGPGIHPGSVSPALVQNTDLAPTFEDIAGATTAGVDGSSILPLLRRAPGDPSVLWRSAALVEHHGLDFYGHENDPDFQSPAAGDPPTYDALRTATFTYVHYYNGQREYYNRIRDPYELDNIVASLRPSRIAALDRDLNALHTCHGSIACWRAGQPRPTT